MADRPSNFWDADFLRSMIAAHEAALLATPGNPALSINLAALRKMLRQVESRNIDSPASGERG